MTLMPLYTTLILVQMDYKLNTGDTQMSRFV